MTLDSLLLGGRLSHLSNYFSVSYLVIFLPLAMLIYSITPAKAKKYVLLALNFIFFWLISGKLVLVLAVTALSIHYFGLWLDRLINERDAEVKQTERSERKAVKKKKKN